MGKSSFIDFIVDYYPEKESLEDLSQKILIHLFYNRHKANKPTVICVAGDSGEGKSWTVLTIVWILLRHVGIAFKDYVNDVIIYTPMEYRGKVDKLLHAKELKKIFVAVFDEARELIKAKRWQSLLNQVIADVNAMSRKIKPLVFFVVTQSIMDIDKATRHTVTYYAECYRPQGQRVRFDLRRIYKDTRDIENPKLKTRRIYGYVRIHKEGKKPKYEFFMPTSFRFKSPPKEITDIYEPANFEAKSKIIRQKLDLMLNELDKDFKDTFSKVDSMVDWYVSHPDQLSLFVKRARGKVTITKDFKKMHELTDTEGKEFKKRLLEKLQERGLADVEAKSTG